VSTSTDDHSRKLRVAQESLDYHGLPPCGTSNGVTKTSHRISRDVRLINALQRGLFFFRPSSSPSKDYQKQREDYLLLAVFILTDARRLNGCIRGFE
jgi:hypothetical protein